MPIKIADRTFYAPAEVAELMHKTPGAVRYLMRSGKLKAHKFGPRKWYISEDALLESVSGGTTKQPNNQG